ncbi:putrescine importer [Scopulibacillus darangshiensis]|uniref:Putrescine importer n=1 Tax=Scopulibacillus darangshiensis TaxID=442528 RepID=A0A4R2PAD7_9BACL|nr:APC family permease [Scopulibacillus darangshiensis]TCP31234.1 putrescine importer [Scopulibacillus darangshiensis]
MEQKSGLKRSLGLRHVTLYGLAFMAPTTVFSTYGVAVEKTQGMMPTAYIIAMIIMLFTAYSYGQMVKEFPSAGSAYTFTQKAIHPNLGFLIGWTILIDYVLSPMISALLVGIVGHAYFPAVPLSIWVISFILVIAVVNVLGIKIAANFNTYFLILQLASFLLFFFISIKGLLEGKGAGTVFSILPFYDPDVKLSSIISTVPILCFTFLGFDAITTLSEETKHARRTLPKAIYIIVFSGGVLYVITTYFLQTVFPGLHFKDPQSAHMEIFAYIGGSFLTSCFTAVSFTAGFASATASCGSGARILYVMGREGVLPKKIFGYLSPKFHTPVFNILIIGCIALSALFLNIVTALSFINYGGLFAFTFVNLAVIVHYYIKKRQRSPKGTIMYLVIPLIGAFFTAVLWLQLDNHSMILGSTWLAAGVIYLLYLTKLFRQPPPELRFEETEQA